MPPRFLALALLACAACAEGVESEAEPLAAAITDLARDARDHSTHLVSPAKATPSAAGAELIAQQQVLQRAMGIYEAIIQRADAPLRLRTGGSLMVYLNPATPEYPLGTCRIGSDAICITSATAEALSLQCCIDKTTVILTGSISLVDGKPRQLTLTFAPHVGELPRTVEATFR